MEIYIKTKRHKFIWNYKKCFINIACIASIAIAIQMYANWFVQYQNYLESLIK